MFQVVRKFSYNLISLFLFLTCLITSTVNASPIYAEVDVMRTSVSVDSTDFVITLPKIKLGYMFTPQVMFELQYTSGDDDEQDNSILKIKNISAAYLRLGSPPSTNLRAYIILGYADTSLELTGQNDITDNYDGFSGGLVLEHSVWSKESFVTAEYNAFYNNDDVTVSAFSLGFRYVF